jgi:hypothetical protein
VSPVPTPITRFVEEIFFDAVEATLIEENNLKAAHELWDSLLDDGIARGSIHLDRATIQAIVHEHLWRQVNSTASRRTTDHLTELATGQLTMDADEFLDIVVTAGKHRRTTIRHLHPDDVAKMAEERKQNAEKARIASRTFDATTAKTIIDWLTTYGSIPAAIKAGAIKTMPTTPAVV